MKKTNYRILTLIGVMLFILFISVPMAAADVCGTADQACEDPFNPEFWGYNLASSPIGQSFTPTEPYVNCVAVRLQNFGWQDDRVYLQLREGSINGPFINAADVPSQPIEGDMAVQWVLFRFCYPQKVTPGNQYVIRLETDRSANSEVGWMTRDINTSTDYPGGNAIVNGQVVTYSDLNFRTYYKAQAGAVIPRITNAWISSDSAGLNPIDSVEIGSSFYAQIEYNVPIIIPEDTVFWTRSLASLGFWLTDHIHRCATDSTATVRDYINIRVPEIWPWPGTHDVIVAVWAETHEADHAMDFRMLPINVTP